MAKKSIVCIGVAAVLMIAAVAGFCAEVQRDFRQVAWGASEAQIVAAEGKNPTVRTTNEGLVLIGFADRIAGLDCNVLYILASGKLTRAKYVVNTTHSNRTDYLSDRDTLHKALTAKYGEPASDQTYWKNDLYKSDPSEWGMALAVGHLAKFASWELPRTTIILYVSGDNFEISLGVEYSSKELESLEDQVKSADQQSKF